MSDFEHTSREVLRSSEQHISEADLFELRSIRQKAVSQPMRRLPGFLKPMTGMVAASLVAIALIYNPAGNKHELNTDTAELYEDLDFYYWLVDEKQDVRS